MSERNRRVIGKILRGQFASWCSYCHANHYHGIGNDPTKPTLGERGSHCWSANSPFFGRAYEIDVFSADADPSEAFAL